MSDVFSPDGLALLALGGLLVLLPAVCLIVKRKIKRD